MNPWEEISLSDYENHMSLKTVYQLQILNGLMKEQIRDCNMKTLAILGVAGGNGLEYISGTNIETVYGLDINQEYINAVNERYNYLGERLKCLCLDVIENSNQLPKAEFIIANLFLEYVGYDAFIGALNQMESRYVSCVIQVNGEENWVSDSPYEKCFDGLDTVHHLITEDGLKEEMEKNNFEYVDRICKPLPNGKQLLRIDFIKG